MFTHPIYHTHIDIFTRMGHKELDMIKKVAELSNNVFIHTFIQNIQYTHYGLL